jgi:prevent-host-death family protein
MELPCASRSIHAELSMFFDHASVRRMKEMTISKFKATCLAVLEQVRKTKRPVRITRFGKPVAEVVPPSPQSRGKRVLGFMKGRMEVRGDIVHANPWLESEEAKRHK